MDGILELVDLRVLGVADKEQGRMVLAAWFYENNFGMGADTMALMWLASVLGPRVLEKRKANEAAKANDPAELAKRLEAERAKAVPQGTPPLAERAA